MTFSQEHELLYGQCLSIMGACFTIYSFFKGDGSFDLHLGILLSWGLGSLCLYVMCSRYQQREYELSQENWKLRQEINDLKNKKPPCGGPLLQ